MQESLLLNGQKRAKIFKKIIIRKLKRKISHHIIRVEIKNKIKKLPVKKYNNKGRKSWEDKLRLYLKS